MRESQRFSRSVAGERDDAPHRSRAFARRRTLIVVASVVASVAWLSLVSAVMTFAVMSSDAEAEEVANATMQSLDEQVQEIKSDVLGIASELSQLEEKLIYPSDTQVAIFVSLEKDEKARLDSVEIRVDGEPVARHIYSFKELEAMQKGGVQRIYTGNLPTGPHRLDVIVAGELSGGRQFGGTEAFQIEKTVGPKLVDLVLAANELGRASIRIEDE